MSKELREYINRLVLERSLKGNLEPDCLKFIAPRSLEIVEDLYPNLLCQDMEKKLSMWFESKPDAREVFRRGGSIYKGGDDEC